MAVRETECGMRLVLRNSLVSVSTLAFILLWVSFILSFDLKAITMPDIYFVDWNQMEMFLSGTPSLDWVVGGFPKCGTSALTALFDVHNETSINQPSSANSAGEICNLFRPKFSVDESMDQLRESLAELDPSPSVKRAFKLCPGGHEFANKIERLHELSPSTGWIFGLRHPIRQVESFYNYRVTNVHEEAEEDQEQLDEIPPLESLTTMKDHWKSVSIEATRYEVFLKQFGKLGETTEELLNYTNHEMEDLRVVANNFTIFLFDIDQIGDTNSTRNESFRESLRELLGLQTPLPIIPRANVNVKKTAYPESIDICDSRYKPLRTSMLPAAQQTAAWILRASRTSSDFQVANPDHFAQLLDRWNRDPCDDEAANTP